MSASRFGKLFSVSTFGESHGPALGCVIDGCPAGIAFSEERLAAWMVRRRPGQNALVTARSEADKVEVLAGVFENRTTGAPVAMMVRNTDARSHDYTREKATARHGHAVDLWEQKFGHVDFRGSGRASGRETVSRVMAGAVAEMFVREIHPSARVQGLVSEIGPWKISPATHLAFHKNRKSWAADAFPTRMPDADVSAAAEAGLLAAKANGESYGGVCELSLENLPAGLGQPVFHKFRSDLASAMMGVGATAGVEFGEGFQSAAKKGSDFHGEAQSYGGQRGGITTGEAIHLRVAFKPASTLGSMAKSGRHDPCIVPRALPVLEAMAWLVIADHLLWKRLDQR